MTKRIVNYLLKKYTKKLWNMAGNIANRFHDKKTGEYDDLQEKLYYWITSGIKDF